MSAFGDEVRALVVLADASSRMLPSERAPLEPEPARRSAREVTDAVTWSLLLRGQLQGGGSIYCYRDKTFGAIFAKRFPRGKPDETVYLCAEIPDREFQTWFELRQAMKAIP